MKKIVLLFLSFLFIGKIAFAVETKPSTNTSFNVEEAISDGDHKGLAAYYRSLAAEQRKIVETHQKMKTSYRDTHVHYKGIESAMASHCGNLIFKANELAKEYEKLAEEEEKLIPSK